MSPLLMNTLCTEIEDRGVTSAQLKMKMAGVESENRVVTEVQLEKVAKRSSRDTSRASSAASLKSVVLTERDFDVLTFILDMKFASAREVFLKFFRVTNDNSESKSDAWAKKRLLQLEKAGFVRGTYAFSESTKYYVGTYRAFYAIKNFKLGFAPSKPTFGFDNRTFIHDKLLLQTRIELERAEGATNWISDRMLRSGMDRSFGFSASFVPDGIFTSSDNSLVAVELEIATKAKSRYREKVKSYVSLIRKTNSEFKIGKVRFLCHRDQPFQILKQEARIFGDLFVIERVNANALIGGVA